MSRRKLKVFAGIFYLVGSGFRAAYLKKVVSRSGPKYPGSADSRLFPLDTRVSIMSFVTSM